ncbi:MAG: sensor histidine kinase [Bacillota bacterium]
MIASLMKSWTIWMKIGVILFGVFLLSWLGPDEIGLTDLLISLREGEETGNQLMLAVFLLVSLNTVLALFHYIGALLLGDEIAARLNRPWLKIIIPLIVIPLDYIVINAYYSLTYSFSAYALLLLLAILLLQAFEKDRLKPIIKTIICSQLIFGIEWLNEIPSLSRYGFGQGSISKELTDIAVQIGFEQSLTLYSLTLCLIFVINAVILAVYFSLAEQKWRIKQELHYAQLEAMQSRSGREALYLVHDLKTPLTAIEGLNSLISMKVDDSKIKEYCQRISASILSVSDMISEILYDDKKHWCRIKDLVEYVEASRLSGTNLNLKVDFQTDPEIKIFINKIRMTRALVNLIDNAYDAVNGVEDGKILLKVKNYENELWLGVSDNGIGISPKEQEKIWKAGFSTKSHPGMGLAFVRQVAEGHGASVEIDSKLGHGTIIWIKLAEGSVSR